MQNTVLKYLEKTVELYPEKTAVVDANSKMTFCELKNSAITIAQAIYIQLGKTRQPILVYLPKSARSIAAFMGILYSGNFYTPTDVKFPFEKVKGIIDSLQPSLIITDEQNYQILIKNGVQSKQILNLDSLDTEYNKIELPTDDIIDTDVVYILFTSGSTGVPKGVVISNRSIVDYIDWAKDCYKITSEDSIGNQAPFYFDNSTLDIYLMLSTGATLYVIPESLFSFPAKLIDYVLDKQITTIFWVPSVYINIANADILSRKSCSCLRKILFAGEVMPNKCLNYWRTYLPDALYSNLYGPTEITVDCTYYIVNRKFRNDEPLPIGFPCMNSNVMLLNQDRKLIEKQDQIGEICVRGSSLALGYWNNLQKTNEVFIQNPLNAMYPERIYCTGDLAHYNEYGELIFDGRKDSQIKHMGYRIELGEIEMAALAVEGVQEACALYDAENREIMLFVVMSEGLDKLHLRKQLLNKIPKYMVPTKYIGLSSLPQNDNGKIDRKRLEEQYLQV